MSLTSFWPQAALEYSTLLSDLSGGNPLVTVPPSADLLALLTIFSRGTHRVLVAEDESDTIHGLVEDYRLLQWFNQHVRLSAMRSTLDD